MAKEGKKVSKQKPATKSEVFTALAERTELSKKDITVMFDALTQLIKDELVGKKAKGVFVLPGLLKLTVVRKPATKDRPGINPFTKEAITVKGKPASNKVRSRPLKGLNDLVGKG